MLAIWSEKGVNYIEDLFDYRIKTFHQFQYLSELYTLPNTEIMHYDQTLSSLSSKCKEEMIKEQISNTHTSLIHKILKSKQIDKTLYKKNQNSENMGNRI